MTHPLTDRPALTVLTDADRDDLLRDVARARHRQQRCRVCWRVIGRDGECGTPGCPGVDSR